MEKGEKKEFVFYYESRQNPNGDPGFDNQPRKQSDDTIIVTDVRIKRTIRDYAKSKGETIFVDYDKNGEHTTANARAEELIGDKIDGQKLLEKTFDTPLFGGLVTIHPKKNEEGKSVGKGDSVKITGPVQFAIGRSVNKVNIINPQISSIFTGDEKKGEHGTFGTFYSVEYALIKTYGAINPENLGHYYENEFKFFKKSEEKLFEYLWEGTNRLITRSKYPQRSLFFIEVTYNNAIYNDLNELTIENSKMKEQNNVKQMIKPVFDFEHLVSVLKTRKDKIIKIRIAACDDLKDEANELGKQLTKEIPNKIQIIET
jgi:CRISPR-associated protein Csh2